MRANVCSQCGAPLTDDVCSYCGVGFDVDNEQDSYELNDTGFECNNVTNISNDVGDLFAMLPIIITIVPIALFIGWIKTKLFGEIES